MNQSIDASAISHEAMQALIKAGAEVDLPNVFEMTPLMVAVGMSGVGRIGGGALFGGAAAAGEGQRQGQPGQVTHADDSGGRSGDSSEAPASAPAHPVTHSPAASLARRTPSTADLAYSLRSGRVSV